MDDLLLSRQQQQQLFPLPDQQQALVIRAAAAAAAAAAEAPSEAQLRLTSDSGDGSSGLLEVYHEGVWGTVCDDHFDTNNNGANVACRQLGFASGTEYSENYASHDFGFGLDDVQCTGFSASKKSNWLAVEFTFASSYPILSIHRRE